MSGHWEAEQYKEQLEASRTAHAACEAARREGLAEIDRLRTELAEAESSLRATKVCADRDWNRSKLAEARLAAVIALCDGAYLDTGNRGEWTQRVRAATEGEVK